MAGVWDLTDAAAYGGAGWSPRTSSSREEVGSLWARCGVYNEWSALRAVLLHAPGEEVRNIEDPASAQMIGRMDVDRARAQHQTLARAYRAAGVTVSLVEPGSLPPPNLMFVADLIFMTPEGAILGRPASTVRAGEERFVAAALARLGIPILRSIRGTGVFEGADAAWIDERTVMIATGLRTNDEGARQVASMLAELGIDTIRVGLTHGTMHLMGVLRFADRDLALAWPGRVPWASVDALRARGIRVLFLPSEVMPGMALNFVTLAPRSILMPSGNPITQGFYEEAGITCTTVAIDELAKGAGGIGCMTGILERG